MNDPIPHYSPSGPWQELVHEPLVDGDPRDCHFCGEALDAGDLFEFHIRQQRSADGTVTEDDSDWWAAGEVIPVCDLCRESINAPDESIDEHTGESRKAANLRYWFDRLFLIPTVVGVVAMFVAVWMKWLGVL